MIDAHRQYRIYKNMLIKQVSGKTIYQPLNHGIFADDYPWNHGYRCVDCQLIFLYANDAITHALRHTRSFGVGLDFVHKNGRMDCEYVVWDAKLGKFIGDYV